jgi:hypothetical protein
LVALALLCAAAGVTFALTSLAASKGTRRSHDKDAVVERVVPQS